MSYKIKPVVEGQINRLTPLEIVLQEITEIRTLADNYGYENDVKVLEGVETLIFKKMYESEEEKIFIAYGMSLLTSKMHPDALNNNQLLDAVFNQAKQCFEELFNAKELFYENLKKYNNGK